VLLLNPPRPAFLSGSSTAFPPSGGLACRTGSDRLAQRRDGIERPPTSGPQFLLLLSSPPASPFFFFPDSGSGMGMALAGCASLPPAAKGSAPGRRSWPPPLPPLFLRWTGITPPWGGGVVQGGGWAASCRVAPRVWGSRAGGWDSVQGTRGGHPRRQRCREGRRPWGAGAARLLLRAPTRCVTG
jgi:hypothetical protein